MKIKVSDKMMNFTAKWLLLVYTLSVYNSLEGIGNSRGGFKYTLITMRNSINIALLAI